MPWILCGPGRSPESTAEVAGSTAITRVSGLRSRSICPTPVIVPPVPTAATKAPISPPVSRQISSAVVSRWIRGLAGLENWSGMNPLRCSAISRASSTASVMPPSDGVSRTSAP